MSQVLEHKSALVSAFECAPRYILVSLSFSLLLIASKSILWHFSLRLLFLPSLSHTHIHSVFHFLNLAQSTGGPKFGSKMSYSLSRSRTHKYT